MKRDASTSCRECTSPRNQERDADRATARSTPARGSVAALHRAAGNNAIQSVAREGAADDEEEVPGEGTGVAEPGQRTPTALTVRGGVGDAILQPKLAVGSPADASEREADRVADEVLGLPGPPRHRGSGSAIDREAGNGEPGPDRPSVRRRPSSRPSADGQVEASVARRIQSVRSGGRQLSDSVRSFFEPRFGADLSDVRIHTGPDAAATAGAMGAKAYTVGRDIVFNRGEYQPGSPDGRRLLAHELTHVLQQRPGGEAVSRQLGVEDYPDCTEGITGVENPTDHLEDARMEAIDLVDLAIASLQRAANGNAGSRVQNALATHFQIPNQRQIRTVISNYRQSKPRLELPHRMICNTGDSAICRGNTQGYAWPNTGPYIHLCPGAVQDEDLTPLIMIHEATHIGAGTDDHSYIWQNSYSNMSSAQAVDNADSYAYFAEAVEIEITAIN